MKNFVFLIIFFTSLFSSITLFSQSVNTLWFNRPADYFEECFVLGNGKMGASVFGGVTSDKIYLNDITLWSGEPVNANQKPEAYKDLPAVREALKNEDYKLADNLNKKLQGDYSQSYSPLGTMFLNFKHTNSPSDYSRELNISNAIATVRYQVDGVQFTREYFVSYPSQVMVIKLTSSRKGALIFDLKFNSLLKYSAVTNLNRLEINGYAQIKAIPSYVKGVPDAVVFDEEKGTRFTTLAKVEHTDGTLFSADSMLSVVGASEATIYVSIATSFNGFDKNPATEGRDNKVLAEEQLKSSKGNPYDKIKDAHVSDYRSFFDRVALYLGSSEAPELPINERLVRYAQGYEDKNLEILYFQYGRYLLISSSRTPGVPANLQGLWNSYIRPPWSSNYTVNINLEENYWPAEIVNLSEMHMPLMGFIKNIAKTGAITAKTFYGIDKGWVACHNSDIWAMSNPVTGHPMWANWNMGGTWLSTHLWEHYLFTQDETFLEEDAYPLLKGAAEFCLAWMVEDKDGKLITSPSTSPENLYITPSGYKGATLYGGTADLAMIRELFIVTVKAAEVLEVDETFKRKLDSALVRLYPYNIGADGALQEWYFDWKDADPKHRHQSHLFGLFPGHHITPDSTPELANACRKALEIKGDETTGWSKGWRINLWARLGDGDRAYKMYRELLRFVDPSGKSTQYSKGGGTYPNLLDAHPPFQIDGNFGGTAAVAEMLVQSTETEITLLPALPSSWSRGAVRGICTRGGFEIAMEWDRGVLRRATILAKSKGTVTIKSGDKQQQISLRKGQKRDIIW